MNSKPADPPPVSGTVRPKVPTRASGVHASLARWLVPAVYASLFGGLTWAWHATSLHEWADADKLSHLGRELMGWRLGPLAVWVGYVLAVMLALPIFLLVTVSALVFGPWLGIAWGLGGLLSGASVGYLLGRLTGGRFADRLTHPRAAGLVQALQQRGLWAMVFVRVVPVAPFLLVNLTAGALRVRVRDYLLGTFLGLLPATVLIPLFMDRLAAAWRQPSLSTYAALGLFVALALAALTRLRRSLSIGG